MIKVTHRVLSAVSGFSIHQLKRWAVKLFDKDPEADQAGGIVREFSLNDGFEIYLMGILVANYRFPVKEAQKHAEKILYEIIKMGLSPETRWTRKDPAPIIDLKIYPDGVYEFRTYELRKPEERDFDDIAGEKTVNKGPFRSRWIPAKEMEGNRLPGPEYTIPIAAQLGHYVLTLRGLLS